MGSSITQELLRTCLIIATCKEKVDKLKLVEVGNQFCFENERHFSIEKYTSPESFPKVLAPKGTQT